MYDSFSFVLMDRICMNHTPPRPALCPSMGPQGGPKEPYESPNGVLMKPLRDHLKDYFMGSLRAPSRHSSNVT